MSTAYTRTYNWVNDKNAGTPITASRMDTEHDDITTKLNRKVLIKATAPTSPIAGMFWLDSTNKLLKEYRNTEWVIHGVVHLATTAPTTPQLGDLWFDTTTYTSSGGVLKAYGDAWRFLLSTASLGTVGQFLVSQGLGTNPKFTDGYTTAPVANLALALDTNSRFPVSVMSMQLGSVSLVFSNQATRSTPVTFDAPFNGAPYVLGNTGSQAGITIIGIFTANNITTAGFIAQLSEYQGALLTVTEVVNWAAIGDY